MKKIEYANDVTLFIIFLFFVAERHSGHVIDISNFYTAEEHTDIVRCIVCHESRIYSAG